MALRLRSGRGASAPGPPAVATAGYMPVHPGNRPLCGPAGIVTRLGRLRPRLRLVRRRRGHHFRREHLWHGPRGSVRRRDRRQRRNGGRLRVVPSAVTTRPDRLVGRHRPGAAMGAVLGVDRGATARAGPRTVPLHHCWTPPGPIGVDGLILPVVCRSDTRTVVNLALSNPPASPSLQVAAAHRRTGGTWSPLPANGA